MQSPATISCLALILIVMALSPSWAEEEVHWGYEGDLGPDHWAELSEKYRMCADGRNQSPVDLTADFHAELPEIEYHINTFPITDLFHNGHTIQEEAGPGNWIVLKGVRYDLQQFHFHSPSEHRIEGREFPMEIHYVHASEDGALLVTGFMIELGDEHAGLAKLWNEIPEKAGEHSSASTQIDLTMFERELSEYYLYNGSLTTPPCSEGVTWIIFKNPLEASQEQVDLFQEVIGMANNRPIQPLNSRIVLD